MNGRRYYGRDPSQQLMQFYEQNPFYNPFSPSPDIGAGLSGMLQMALTNRQLMKEQEELRRQQEFENQIALREMAVRERIKEPTERQIPEWQHQWDIIDQLVEAGQLTPQQGAMAKIGVKPEKEKKKWPKASISQITKIFPEYTEESIRSMDDTQVQDLLDEALFRQRPRPPEVERETKEEKKQRKYSEALRQINAKYEMRGLDLKENMRAKIATATDINAQQKLSISLYKQIKDLNAAHQREIDNLNKEFKITPQSQVDLTAVMPQSNIVPTKEPDQFGYYVGQIVDSPALGKKVRYIGNGKFEDI